MIYSEPNLREPGRRLINRIENFYPYHAGFRALFDGETLCGRVSELFGEPAVLFKDKINFKMPGGDGFKPHEDQQAGWSSYASIFITTLVAIDEATAEKPASDGTKARRSGDGNGEPGGKCATQCSPRSDVHSGATAPGAWRVEIGGKSTWHPACSVPRPAQRGSGGGACTDTSTVPIDNSDWPHRATDLSMEDRAGRGEAPDAWSRPDRRAAQVQVRGEAGG